ncbi:MAG: V-type ATPase subunit [Candidatus Izemoplasmatales bacterium]
MSYPYANGVVKALEPRLLDRTKTAKLARADKGAFLKGLSDVGYGRIVPGDTVETAIARELRDYHALLDGTTPDKRATDLFFLAEDAMNLKLLLKRRLFGAPAFDAAEADGAFLFPGLSRAILDDDFEELDPSVAAFLHGVVEAVAGTDAGSLSAAVDRAIYAQAFRSLGLLPDRALRTYLQAKVDFANVTAIFRMRRLGWKAERLAAVFVPGGRYALETLAQAFDAAPVDAARLLQDHYDEKVSRIVRDQTEKRSLSILESLFSELLLETAGEFRDDGFGIGPIIYYHLEKRREADLVRSLYARAEDRPAV